MRVLVVGSGGREHALAWAIAASPLVDKLYCAPGNAGIAEVAECVPIRATDIDGLVAFCQRERIDFVVVGPEAPLVGGFVDCARGRRHRRLGPKRGGGGARKLEGISPRICAPAPGFRPAPIAVSASRPQPRPISPSAARRSWSRLMASPRARVSSSPIRSRRLPFARSTPRWSSAVSATPGMRSSSRSFSKARRPASSRLSTARTHSRSPPPRTTSALGEGDTGPNTGGMGAYSPAAALTPALEGQAMDRIIMPTIAAMREQARRSRASSMPG